MSATISNSSQPDSTTRLSPRYRPSTRNDLYVRNRSEELRAIEKPHIERRYVDRDIRELYRRIALLEAVLGLIADD